MWRETHRHALDGGNEWLADIAEAVAEVLEVAALAGSLAV